MHAALYSAKFCDGVYFNILLLRRPRGDMIMHSTPRLGACSLRTIINL